MIQAKVHYSEEVKAELKKYGIGVMPRIKFGLTQFLDKVANVARTIVPVKTGRLQSSLSYEVNDKGNGGVEGRVGTNVKYGKWVELGHRIMRHGKQVGTAKPKPYLLPAFQKTLPELVDFIKKALK